MPVVPGTRLGPYEILSPLGAGGMGEVYRARDMRLDREVALKVLPERLAGDAHARARFEREAKAVAALSHPNVLAIHDFSAHDEVWYAVTELLVGETLRERLNSARIPYRRAIEIGAEIAEGLTAAHGKGVIHRDLKPENVFLTTEGRVKILDFGLAFREDDTFDGRTTSFRSEPGTVVGTTAYMSPEQLRGEALDASTDLFSLGCVLYEMLAGRRPFSGPNAAVTIGAILSAEPPELGAAIPVSLRAVVNQCLQKDRARRFRSARDLALMLRAASVDSEARTSDMRAAVTSDSVAIIPFRLSRTDEDLEYLSDGLAESLVNSLTRIGNLRVVPASTMLRLGRDAEPRAVAAQTSARTVLTGRVTRLGDRIVVAVELIDVAADAQIWGERYHRQSADVLDLPQVLARDITEHLRAQLTNDERERLARAHSGSREAHAAYLKGRFYFNKRNEASLRRAISFFREAIDIDPLYAPALAGVADSYVILGMHGVPSHDCGPKAKAAALAALEIDDDIPEAYASLGLVRSFYDWDWERGERDLRRAIALNPSYALAHHWLGIQLAVRRRFDEAQEQVERARDLDPLSMIFMTGIGNVFRLRRQFERAVAEYRKAMEIESAFLPALLQLADACIHLAMLDDAAAAVENALRIAPENTEAKAIRTRILAGRGQTEKARRIQRELIDLASTHWISPLDLASTAVALGQHDQAFAWLDQALEERPLPMGFIAAEAQWDVIRSDPRFAAVLRKLNL
jgi:serine/threonine protein kinase/Tfp pilus assembly protein PilF